MTESSRSSSEASSSGSVPARLTDTADGLQALYSRLWRSWSVMEYCSSFRADFSEADMRLLVTAVQQLTKAGDELGRLVRAAVPSPLADPQMARGIRMLGVLPSEHPHAAVYNEALELAAAYVEKVWCQPGRGANAQREDRAAVPSPQPSSVPPPVALPVIPRYRMTRPAVLFHDDGSMAVRPVDDPAGAWVRAEDAERALQLVERVAAFQRKRADQRVFYYERLADLYEDLEGKLLDEKAMRLLAEQQRDSAIKELEALKVR